MAVLSSEEWSDDNQCPELTAEHFDAFRALDIDHDQVIFDPCYQEYFDLVWNSPPRISLALEQCCDETGALLSFSLRETRLQNAPFEIKIAVEQFLKATPARVRDYLILECFWLLRLERAERTGRPSFGK